jgi:hypothetical protein
MIRALTQNLLARQTTGVPRRMALGALFVLVSIFCIIFKALTWVGMNPLGILAVGVYCTAIAAGQALMFEGRRPRDASIIVGSIVMPMLIALVSIVFYFRGFTILESLSWVCLGVCSFVVSPVVGYLVGIFLAGGFLLFEQVVTGGQSTTDDSQPHELVVVDGQTVRQLQSLPSWLREHPLAMVTLCFVLIFSFCGFVLLAGSRGLSGVIPTARLVEAALWIPAFVAFLTGVAQFRARSAWVLLPALLAGYALLAKFQTLQFAKTLDGHTLTVFVVAAALLAVIVLFAALGWLQILLRRIGIWKTDLQMKYVYIIAFVFMVGWFGGLWVFMDRYSKSPSEQAIQTAVSNGIDIQYARNNLGIPILPPLIIQLRGLDIDKPIDDSLQELNNATGLASLRVADFRNMPGLTDRSISTLTQKPMWTVAVTNTGISPRAFENTNTQVLYLSLANTAVDDSTLADLVPKKGQISGLQWLTLDNTKVTDQGLSYLSKHNTLRHLSMDGCQITGEGFADCKPSKQEIALSFRDTNLNDQGATELLKVFTNISHVDVCGTALSRIGFQRLYAAKNLVSISVAESQFPRDFLESLSQSYPGVNLTIDD